MDEIIEIAESIINKWDSDSSAYAKVTSLFQDDRHEAKRYLNSISDLQSTMKHLVKENSSSEKIVTAQNFCYKIDIYNNYPQHLYPQTKMQRNF